MVNCAWRSISRSRCKIWCIFGNQIPSIPQGLDRDTTYNWNKFSKNSELANPWAMDSFSMQNNSYINQIPSIPQVFDRDTAYNWNKFSQNSDITNPWAMVNPMTPPSMSHPRDFDRPFKAYQRNAMNLGGNPFYGSSQQFQASPISLMTHSEASCLTPISPTTTTSPTMPMSCHMGGVNGMIGSSGMRSHGIRTHSGNSTSSLNSMSSGHGQTIMNSSNSPNITNNLSGVLGSPPHSGILNMSNMKNETESKPTYPINRAAVPPMPVVSPSLQNNGQNKSTNNESTSAGSTDSIDESISNSIPDSNTNDREHTVDGIKIPPKKRHLVIPECQKDAGYYEKRKKNNDSAKRSRESRRMKEEQIALRVVYLEQENLQLRTEVSLLKSEIEKLRCMLYSNC